MTSLGEARNAEALADVLLLRQAGRRRSALLLEYRCDGRGTSRRCLLLAAYGTSRGPVLHWPGQRVPTGLQHDTGLQDNPDGLARFLYAEKTQDVDPQSFLLASKMTLSCRHYPADTFTLSRSCEDVLRDLRERRGATVVLGP